MATADQVLAAAAAELGTVESPANSNKTKYGRWYGADANPWCAMFVSWIFAHQGLPLPASTSKGFAYTPAGAAWFQKQGRWTHTPRRGHVVFYDFPGDGVNRISHVGIVEKVNANGSIVAIEGNTSPGNGGSQRDGGGVYRRTRSTGIVGYGVPAYGPQEDDMTPDQEKVLRDTATRLENIDKVLQAKYVQIDTIEETVKKLEVGGVDVNLVASKVADLLAERLKS